jgi:hypothetical protein
MILTLIMRANGDLDLSSIISDLAIVHGEGGESTMARQPVAFAIDIQTRLSLHSDIPLHNWPL